MELHVSLCFTLMLISIKRLHGSLQVWHGVILARNSAVLVMIAFEKFSLFYFSA